MTVTTNRVPHDWLWPASRTNQHPLKPPQRTGKPDSSYLLDPNWALVAATHVRKLSTRTSVLDTEARRGVTESGRETQTMLKRLLVHTSAYTVGNLLVTVASFISFPILSRLFTVAEYGILNLISATLLLLTAIGKLGIQHATVRYYAEVVAGKREIGLKEFYSTVVFGMAGSGLVIATAWAIIGQAVPAEWWNQKGFRGLLLLTAALVFIRVCDSGIVNILRAQQRSSLYSAYAVVKRYAELGIVLVVVLRIIPGLVGFYVGTIVAEGVAMGVLFLFWRSRCSCVPSSFSPALFKAMLAFGVPMIGSELGAVLLSLGDRYVLQTVRGGESVGLYAAAYNLCEYVRTILILSIAQAIVPMYVRIWEEKGDGETIRFIQQALHFYLLLAAAFVAGLAAIGDDLLSFVASEKYRAGAEIIPYVIAGMALDGMWPMLGASLVVHKRAGVVVAIMTATAAFNIGLNIALVPKFGIKGAAIATLVSYGFVLGGTFVAGRRRLPLRIPWWTAAKFSAFAWLMYLSLGLIHASNVVTSLLAKVLVGLVSYAVMVLLFDRTAREALQSLWIRMRVRAGHGDSAGESR